MPFTIRTANQQMRCAKMLVFAENDEALRRQWMERVRDSDFAGQNSGIMNCLLTAAARAQLLSTRCSERQDSTASIPNVGCAKC